MNTQKLAVTAMWILAAASGLAQKPTIALRIENEARVDERVLRDTRRKRIEMLNRAGVTLIWADCGHCGTDWEKSLALPSHTRAQRVLDDRHDESARLEPKGNLWGSPTSPMETA